MRTDCSEPEAQRRGATKQSRRIGSQRSWRVLKDTQSVLAALRAAMAHGRRPRCLPLPALSDHLLGLPRILGPVVGPEGQLDVARRVPGSRQHALQLGPLLCRQAAGCSARAGPIGRLAGSPVWSAQGLPGPVPPTCGASGGRAGSAAASAMKTAHSLHACQTPCT